VPTDIGEVSLATRSMFRNRLGFPRSWTRATIENVNAAIAPSRPERRRVGRPVRSAPAAIIEEPAASPPAKRYAGMSFSHGDGLTIARP
jgi:hypothetical protein